jgi:SAM-dependent methyltransferase
MMKFGLQHPQAVARAIYYGQRWRLKRWLGIPDRPRAPVLESGLDHAVERYRRICCTLLPHLANRLPKNFVAAEIGCGDCLAAADMMLGLGAQHVHLVEHQAMPLTPVHRQALSRTISPDLPNRASILSSDDPPRLNPALATLHVGLLENLSLPQPVDLVYSFDVLEHVEDLDAFFSCCRRTLKLGGLSLHKFDLSGHEFFEDPMPPLDFQTYPRWLYRLMFPRYRRAVGNFADLFFNLMRKNGFEILEIVPLRVADPHYLHTIRPQLRKEARMKSDEVLRFLDLIVLARRA